MLDSAYLRKVIGHDFHEIRTQINAPGMSETITPDWELLVHHLAATAQTPFTEAELEGKLFSDHHLRHGEDSKEARRATCLAAMERESQAIQEEETTRCCTHLHF